MKKSIVKKLVVLLAVMALAGGFVFGASDTASVVLNGSVAPFVSITAGSNSAALGALVPGEAASVSINLTERSNKGGYTVQLDSDNNGRLKLYDSVANTYHSGSEAEAFIGYTATYEGVSVDLASGSATVTSNGTRTSGTGVQKSFSVSATASESNFAGDYRDDLTFTITAN